MAKEKQCYRDMLEELNKSYPDRQFIKPDETASFIGCSRSTVDRKYKQYFISGLGISKVQLARLLCV